MSDMIIAVVGNGKKTAIALRDFSENCNHKCMECMHYVLGKDDELHCVYEIVLSNSERNK